MYLDADVDWEGLWRSRVALFIGASARVVFPKVHPVDRALVSEGCISGGIQS